VQPPAIQEATLKHYARSSATTELKLFEGRAHYTIGQDGWEEVADYALDWARKAAAARVGAASS